MIEVGDVELCAEAFGAPGDPPTLLVQGLGASMLWWEEGFCRMLAAAGRFVIRYDHRDTGRSTASEPGRPSYASSALVTDAAAVLDGFGVAAAHIVGVSAGGALAQRLAIDVPARVLSLVLISTSPATAVGRELPPPTRAFLDFAASADVAWADTRSVVEHLVAYGRVLAGPERPFDETAYRALVERDLARAGCVAALQNHDLVVGDDEVTGQLSAISVPTLVVHGAADPLFPLAHGEALAAAIPGARLVALDGAGHGVDRVDWADLVAAIVAHTTLRD